MESKEQSGILYEITLGGKTLNLKDLPIKLKPTDKISIKWEEINAPTIYINGVELK